MKVLLLVFCLGVATAASLDLKLIKKLLNEIKKEEEQHESPLDAMRRELVSLKNDAETMLNKRSNLDAGTIDFAKRVLDLTKRWNYATMVQKADAACGGDSSVTVAEAAKDVANGGTGGSGECWNLSLSVALAETNSPASMDNNPPACAGSASSSDMCTAFYNHATASRK